MVWSAYFGLPLSLKDAGAALGLDKQKLSEGKELIKYFCVPAKDGTRHLPADAPDRWATFKAYNLRDVETEMGIQERLRNYPVPDEVWEQYHLDQQINDRGIALDRTLVKNAIAMDEHSRQELTAKLQELTMLDNPNSVQQMKSWLADNGLETDTLGKKQVVELLKTAPEPLKSVLVLRQQLAKSSVKKYQAMENTVCADGRVRGMFQFYGASRTGRFCLTGDHEVLTATGWTRLDEWQGGAIACWNEESEAISFQNAQSVSFEYSGEMYSYRDCRIDQCSTPDHKMRVQRRYGMAWEDMTVEQMAHYRPVIPLMGYRYHRGCANPAWLRVLIMTQADGKYTADGAVVFNFKKLRKIARCKSLLRKAEIPFVVSEYKDGVTRISVMARNVPLWLRQFRNKTFGFWLLDENPDIFFDELPNWDGYYPAANSIQYTTTNKQNADIVQALAHMSGRVCIMKTRHHPEHPEWKDAYVLDIWLSPKNGHEIRVKPCVEMFNGKVYCAVTSTGYFLVRRNGRVWVTGNSGRLVQLQNLPQNKMPDLEQARALVRSGNYDAVRLLYDSTLDVLSQLIRTAFVPREGCTFFVADFSAIEARVLAWLAGEEWRMELFRQGGDIYCQSASQMFGVPVEKHGVNGHLRQKGKVAELACIAEGQMVLTDKGEVPIQDVTTDMKVWDGEGWVAHEGLVYRSEREVITYEGLTATPDHLVWVEGQSEPIPLGKAALCHARLMPVSNPSTPCAPFNLTPLVMPTYDLKNAGPHHRFTVSGHLVHNCGYGGSVGALKAMGAIEMGLQEDELKPLVDAWRSANPKIVKLWWEVDDAVMTAIRKKTTTRTHGLLFTCKSGMLFITLPSGRQLAYVKPRIGENQFGSPAATYMGTNTSKQWARLESYGPKFVENVVQAISRDILCYAMQTLRSCSIVAHVHDELIIEADPRMSLEAVCEQMGRTPPWAQGLQLRADGYTTDFYKKD